MTFKRVFGLTISLIILLVMSVPLHAGDTPTIVGVYTKLAGEKFKFDGKTVEVMEFMSFYCHTCYSFESSVQVIKGNFPNKIKWKTVPIYFGEHGSPKPGEAYLLAEDAGKGEEMKKALFKAQMVQKRNIGDIKVLESLGSEIGLGMDFSRKLRGGEKAKDVQKAINMMKAYRVSETPTLIIAGNIMTNPHAFNHNLDVFRQNVIAILKSLLKE